MVFRRHAALAVEVSVDDATALEHAVAQLREQGEIKLDIPARVTRHRGRQLSVTGIAYLIARSQRASEKQREAKPLQLRVHAPQ